LGHPRSTQDIDLAVLVSDDLSFESGLRQDLLIFKAAAGRLIDLADIKTLVDLHERTLDYDYLRMKADELQLRSKFWLRT
jgi:hypothetical protein